MARLQSSAHHLHIADAFKGVIHAAIGALDQDVLNRSVVVSGVDAFAGPELLGDGELGRVDVDADDPFGSGLHRTDDHRKADTAETEHGH